MVLVGKVNKDIVLRLNRHGQPAVGLCGDDGLALPRQPPGRARRGGHRLRGQDRARRRRRAQPHRAGLHPGRRVDGRRPRGQLLQRQRRRGGRRGRPRARRLQGHLPDRRRRLAARPRRPRARSSPRPAPTRSRRRCSTTSRGGMRPKLQACLDAIHGGVTLRAHRRRPRPALAAARALHGRRHRHQDQARRMTPRRPQLLERDHQITPTRVSPVEFVRGEGARLWDDEGNEYLDFLTGLGRQQPRALPPARRRGDPRAGRAPHPRRQPLLHRAAVRLAAAAGRVARSAARCSSRNSGAEANEAAHQARAQGQAAAGDIVVVHRAFHGRTYGALSATPQESKQAPFAPLVPGLPSRSSRRRRPSRRPSTTAHRRGAARAGAGRERRLPMLGEDVLRAAREALRRASAPRSSSTRSSAAWGAPARCGPTSTRASCPTR